MLLTLALGLLNFAFALVGKRLLKLPGFDLTPLAIILLARAGENVWVGALVLNAALAATSWKHLKYLWLSLPATIIVGLLAGLVPGFILLFLVYHVVTILPAFLLGLFGTHYFLFVLVNLGVNLAGARIAGFFA